MSRMDPTLSKSITMTIQQWAKLEQLRQQYKQKTLSRACGLAVSYTYKNRVQGSPNESLNQSIQDRKSDEHGAQTD